MQRRCGVTSLAKVSFVGVTPADADAMSPQFKEDVMLSSIDIFDEQMPEPGQHKSDLTVPARKIDAFLDALS